MGVADVLEGFPTPATAPLQNSFWVANIDDHDDVGNADGRDYVDGRH